VAWRGIEIGVGRSRCGERAHRPERPDPRLIRKVTWPIDGLAEC